MFLLTTLPYGELRKSQIAGCYGVAVLRRYGLVVVVESDHGLECSSPIRMPDPQALNAQCPNAFPPQDRNTAQLGFNLSHA